MISALCLPAFAAKNEVFIVGTLYKRHETVAVYDLQTLRRIILSIKPDVIVLDVTPDELRLEKVHASKIEYPNVIFPLIKSENYRAYAAEPAEPLFGEIVQSVSRGFQIFEKENPDGSAAMKQYTASLFETLKLSWKTPAAVNGALTDKVLSGKAALRENFVAEYKNGQRRWNQHTTDAVLRAVKENPKKRVLVLLGIENCYWVRNALRNNSKINLIDMENWLRAKRL
ncbi:MAG: hypothetical protein M3388_03730 [Acidobacteriota bacterium]|nr:hypothetical protein [Acidobacteriota bacterium]